MEWFLPGSSVSSYTEIFFYQQLFRGQLGGSFSAADGAATAAICDSELAVG